MKQNHPLETVTQTELSAEILELCDGVASLQAVALASLQRGVAPRLVAFSLQNLTGLPSDLDAGSYASQIIELVSACQPLERRIIAELALLPGGTTIHHIVELTRDPVIGIEQAAISLLANELIHWDIVGLRLRKPAAAVVIRSNHLSTEFAAAVEGRISRHTVQDAISPTLIAEESWFELANALERISLPPATLWRGLRLLFDTNGSEPHIERLRHLATLPSNEVGFQLLRACLHRNAGELETALAITAPLIDDPKLGNDARLEQARSLFLAGRLKEAEAILRDTAPLLEPLAASDALRCLALIAQADDRPDDARDLNRRAIHTARSARLRVAEARCNLQLAALESADLKHELALEFALRARFTFTQIGDLHDLDLARITLAQILINLQRNEEAETELNLTRDRLDARRFRYLRANADALLGLSKLDRGDLYGARPILERALATVDEAQPRSHAFVAGIYALLLILEGHRPEAIDRLQTVAAAFAGAGDRLNAGLFGSLAGDLSGGSLGLLTELRDAQNSEFGIIPRSVWARIILRSKQAIGTGIILRSGLGFQIPGNRPVDLSRRNTFRRMLEGLVKTLEAPHTLPTDRLFEIGWPGEEAETRAAHARVYVAISELRKMGLGVHLVREGDGYKLQGLRLVDELPHS
jgi:tetratricopeptide (TPR) repeat protein